jgi:hypothetical protein
VTVVCLRKGKTILKSIRRCLYVHVCSPDNCLRKGKITLEGIRYCFYVRGCSPDNCLRKGKITLEGIRYCFSVRGCSPDGFLINWTVLITICNCTFIRIMWTWDSTFHRLRCWGEYLDLRGRTGGDWGRKWHNEEPYNFNSSSYIIRMITSMKMIRIGHVSCRMHIKCWQGMGSCGCLIKHYTMKTYGVAEV